MKIPKPRRLPSGNWFVQVRADGQSASFTDADRDKCLARAMAFKAGLVKRIEPPEKVTLTKAIDTYISNREGVRSPSTICGYRAIQRGRFKTLMTRPIGSISQSMAQRAILDESKICSPKTVCNAWRFIASVILEQTGERLNVSLPAVTPNEHPFLAPDEIKIFLDVIEGTDIEIPALLGLWSLRRSEMLGLKWESIDFRNRLIRIENTRVNDASYQLVEKKATKNVTSRRSVPMVDRLRVLLMDAPHDGEYVVTANPETLRKRINKVCRENGLPEIGLHGLRHSFASLAYSLNVPEKIAMQIGGWSNDATMKKIYTHIAQSDMRNYQNALINFFESSYQTQ